MNDKTNTIKFDWLTAVIDVDCDPFAVEGKIDYVLNYLHLKRLGNIVPMKHGLYTYGTAFTLSGTQIIIAYDFVSRGKLEIMVQLSGGGVDILQQFLIDDNMSLDDFINAVLEIDGHFSRVDVATDFINYDFHYSPHFLNEQAKSGHLLTSARTCKYVHSYDTTGSHYVFGGNPEQEGTTLYIGKNPKQLRVYNKYAERIAKVGLMYDVSSWYRWEFQFNAPYSQDFIDAYTGHYNYNLAQTWLDYLAGNYRFLYIDLDGAEHQERRKRYANADWWNEIIECATYELRFYCPKDKPNLLRATQWIDKQVMPTVASLFSARLKKYRENGLSYDDAHNLALQQVQIEIDNVLQSNRVDEDKVQSFMNDFENLDNQRKRS